eukprot:3098164-Ditylum_brightwellii.AAC.1
MVMSCTIGTFSYLECDPCAFTSGTPPPSHPLSNCPHHVTIWKVPSYEMMAMSSQQMRHSPHFMNGL